MRCDFSRSGCPGYFPNVLQGQSGVMCCGRIKLCLFERVVMQSSEALAPVYWPKPRALNEKDLVNTAVATRFWFTTKNQQPQCLR